MNSLTKSIPHTIKTPRIDRNTSYFLLHYAKDFLAKHHNEMVYEKNESGFVRVSLPIFHNHIEKIRLNYWPTSTINTIREESIHNHPRYFESIIIDGGYQHELYNKTINKQCPSYSNYKILKNLNNEKKFIFIGQANLELAKTEDVQKGSIVMFPTTMIHRVIQTTPSTLSLNVVFKNNDLIYPSYNVYISPQGDFNDVKLIRENSIEEDATQITIDIIDAIDRFVSLDQLKFPETQE